MMNGLHKVNLKALLEACLDGISSYENYPLDEIKVLEVLQQEIIAKKNQNYKTVVKSDLINSVIKNIQIKDRQFVSPPHPTPSSYIRKLFLLSTSHRFWNTDCKACVGSVFEQGNADSDKMPEVLDFAIDMIKERMEEIKKSDKYQEAATQNSESKYEYLIDWGALHKSSDVIKSLIGKRESEDLPSASPNVFHRQKGPDTRSQTKRLKSEEVEVQKEF